MRWHAQASGRARWVFVVIVSVYTVLLLIYALGFRVVMTHSVPRGVYRTTVLPLQRGTLVAFCLSPPIAAFATARHYVRWGTCPGGSQPLVKPIGALAGDTIELQAEAIRINGRPLPKSATLIRDAHDRPLPHMPWGTYVVAPHEVWLFATQVSESWDSRYFGPIARTQILTTARPVWTLSE